ncbi:hypothetical protein EYC80_008021 [Monilinia laxa]|uniref:Uncharacterized protein n=1 Tax=Monilinia laxa TaxID=61186 RepID=A0A5N6JT78_MONLA|nr:hypothetical protein EYC80_008021 [Monilinia laxa]
MSPSYLPLSIPPRTVPPIPTMPSIAIPEDLIKTMQESIQKSDYEFQCKRHALFMSTWGLFTILVYFLAFVGGLGLIVVTNHMVDEDRKDKYRWTRWWETWGVKQIETTVTPAASANVPMTGYGGGMEENLEGAESDNESEGESLGLPPPYEPSTLNTASISTLTTQTSPINPSTKTVKKAAEQFVKGTLIFCQLVLILFLQALAIQYFIYCDGHRHKKKASSGWVIFYWTISSPMYLGATSSFLCWVILFRDLWGPGAKKKIPIDPSCVWMILFSLIVTAISLVVMIVRGGYKGLIWCVENCQRGFCGGAAEEKGEELETMEEGRRTVNGKERVGAEGYRGGSRNRNIGEEAEDEETVGLVNGSKV